MDHNFHDFKHIQRRETRPEADKTPDHLDGKGKHFHVKKGSQ